MAKTLKADICVIGAGPGGLAIAQGAAAYGVRVVLVDRLSPAQNRARGSLPVVALAAAGRRAQAMREAAAFGLPAMEPEVDFMAVMSRVREVVTQTSRSLTVERLATLGIVSIEAQARFLSRRRLAAGDTVIRARRYVLAAAARPFVPPIEGLVDVGFLTPDTVYGLERRPRHLIVIGGDAGGLELAQAFRRLGSDVTMLVEGAVLPDQDPEMAAVVVRALRAEGVVVREGVRVTAVERQGDAVVRVVAGDAGSFDGDEILLASGHVADVEDLDLKKAHIALKDKLVDVSAMLRTTNRKVYAIGGSTGTHSAHASTRQAHMVLKALLFRLPSKDNAPVPFVVATDPGLAHIGLTEAHALRFHRRVTILRWPFAWSEAAQAERCTAGHVKLLVAPNGRLLGVTIAGAGACDLINIWGLAIARRSGLKDVAELIPPSPSICEIGKSVATSYFAGRAEGRLARNWVRLLQLFG